MPAYENVLSPEQVTQFLERGHIILHDCFDRDVAEQWKRHAFTRLGYDAADPATWEKSRIHMPGSQSVEVKQFAPKAWEAICAVMGGEERVRQPCTWADNFIVNFHDGADKRWVGPRERRDGWHVDGDWFLHFLDGPEQGLLVIVVWSDIEPQGGGTFIACDSVAPVARFLAEHPEGVGPYGFSTQALIDQCTDRVEVTGKTGDVVLLHPFMLHTVSQNKSGRPRFITNPAISFTEPMDFGRQNPDDYSLVERAVLRALGVDRLDFRPTQPRQYLDSKQVHSEQRAKREARAAQT